MKHHKVPPGITFLSIAFSILFAACAGQEVPQPPPEPPTPPPRPTLQHNSTEQRVLSFETSELRFHFTIKNPARNDMQLKSYRYRLNSDGKTLATGEEGTVEISIPAGDSVTLEVPITLSSGKPVSPEAQFKEKHEEKHEEKSEAGAQFPYSFHLDALVEHSPGETVQLTSRTEGTIPQPRLPQIHVSEVVIEQFEALIIRIEYVVEIRNYNSFPVELTTAEYTFSVGGTPWAKGEFPRQLRVSPQKSEILSFPMEINYLKAGRKTVDILIGDKTIDYRITGEGTVQPAEQPVEEEYRFSFNTPGSAAIIRP